jgi:hypothetical protein
LFWRVKEKGNQR